MAKYHTNNFQAYTIGEVPFGIVAKNAGLTVQAGPGGAKSLRITPPASQWCSAYFPNVSFADGIITARAQAGDRANIVFRWSKNGGEYTAPGTGLANPCYSFQVQGSTCYLDYFNNPANARLATVAHSATSSNMVLKVIASGSSIKCYIDNVLYIDTTHTALVNGSFGLMNYTNSSYYTDISVEDFGPEIGNFVTT